MAAARLDREPVCDSCNDTSPANGDNFDALERSVIPQASASTDTRASSLDAPINLTAGQIRWLDRMGLTGISKEAIVDFVDQILSRGGIPEEFGSAELNSSPSEREASMKERIEHRCRQIDAAEFGRKWGTVSGEIKKEFGVKREDMTEGQLRRVWGWLNARYPVR
jgi:hypothetical protein